MWLWKARSTSSNQPSRTKYGRLTSCSSAGPPNTFSVPLSPNLSIACFAASAVATSTAALTLWPSQWPGAPSTMNFGSATPDTCELSGQESYSVWIATTGWPEP